MQRDWDSSGTGRCIQLHNNMASTLAHLFEAMLKQDGANFLTGEP